MKDEILIKFILKESTAEENVAVNQWIELSEENRAYLTSLQRIWTESKGLAAQSEVDVNAAWGKFKDTGVRHLLKIPALSRLHLPIGGGVHIINAATKDHGPSWRMVVQLSDKIEAYGVYPGGQSGNPGSKYYDTFIDNWTNGEYYPLLFMTAGEASQSEQVKWTMTFSKA